MIVIGLSYNGELIIRKTEKNVKINLYYYQKHVLTPIFKEKIPFLNIDNLQCVKFHQDKAPSKTSKPLLYKTNVYLRKSVTKIYEHPLYFI